MRCALRVSGTCQSGKSSGADLRRPSSCLYSSQRPSLHTLLSPSGYPGTAGGRDPRAPPAQGMWDLSPEETWSEEKTEGQRSATKSLPRPPAEHRCCCVTGWGGKAWILSPPFSCAQFPIAFIQCLSSVPTPGCWAFEASVEGKHTHPSGLLLLLHWATKLT